MWIVGKNVLIVNKIVYENNDLCDNDYWCIEQWNTNERIKNKAQKREKDDNQPLVDRD